ncbi:SIS domain-containing protein [Enterococcus plantarum]|uniref:SIS domain-containing protein n=1 Tax=Enterococcus plantarum TaxID=1077675 RepID=UPI001A8DC153|nr:MurR/RpiR family transcriptional regulator [Enterococcus plantarum]MBO0468344.1 MurR/RpiR family transcriptional regulator [Enterococcus plantarum]
MSDIYKDINSNYERLSEAEREVIHFILKFEEIEGLKLKDIKDALYISNTTVIRACKKLNYATFNELKAAFIQSREKKKQIYPKQSNFLHVLDSIKKETLTTLELVDEKNIDKICNCLINARRIFCVGTESSAQVASEFNDKLKSIDFWTNDFSDKRLIERIPKISTFQDVVVVFSLSGRHEELDEIMIEAKCNRTTIISVTNIAATKLKSISTYCVLTSNTGNQKKFCSRLMLHMMSNLIYEKLITKVPIFDGTSRN